MLLRRVWPARRESHGFFDPGRLLREFEHLIDIASRSLSGEPGTGVFPPLNITRDAGRFFVRAELPGVDPNELSVTTEGTKLSLSGRREIPAEQGNVSYHRQERASGSFSRTVVLPSEVDGERVEARYADGILTITLPLSEAAKPRHISVRTS